MRTGVQAGEETLAPRTALTLVALGAAVALGGVTSPSQRPLQATDASALASQRICALASHLASGGV